MDQPDRVREIAHELVNAFMYQLMLDGTPAQAERLFEQLCEVGSPVAICVRNLRDELRAERQKSLETA